MADNNRFDDYLINEYKVIADAHFNTINTISEFFKHYLVIMALPAAVFSFFFQKDFSEFGSLMSAIVFGGISFIGLGVCFYIVNLRFDALLYARTVNGIRKQFYDSSGLLESVKLRVRTLPQNVNSPSYFDIANFFPVLSVFALFNSAYISFSSLLLLNWVVDDAKKEKIIETISGLYYTPLSIFVLFMLLHFYLFKKHANYREYEYLKSNIIGVDVDGVLNKQREHFCTTLKNVANVDLDPDSISHIPVHEMGIGVTKDQEKMVFNSVDYWNDLPVVPGVSDEINKLRNALNFTVIIFTHRPWPNSANFTNDQKKSLLTKWKECTRQQICRDNCLGSLKQLWQLLVFYKNSSFSPDKLINQLTLMWLSRNGIKYDGLFIEKGSETVPCAKSKFSNRFHISANKRIKFFIEDDYEKAIKISYICDIVFLIKHPYNNDIAGMATPPNVIRVDNWNQIYRQIRLMM